LGRGRTGITSFTKRPKEKADFINTKTITELYDENRWKAWDSTNIPSFNTKFFE
jgi:hypothetical protein